MSVKSAIWISGQPGVGIRLIIADAVGDVDATADSARPGDRLLTLLGESYTCLLTGTTKSWGLDGGVGMIAGSVAVIDGATLAAAAEASAIPAANKIVLPANFWRVGRVVEIVFGGKISSANPTPGVAQFKFYLGAVAVYDSGQILLDPVAARVDNPFYGVIRLTARVIGAAAQLMGEGWWASQDISGVTAAAPKGGPVAVIPWATAPALGNAFDSTAAATTDFKFTQTVATGSMTLTQYGLEVKN